MLKHSFITKMALLVVLQITICMQSYSQDKETTESPEDAPIAHHYKRLSSAISLPVYRDFATSPLFYQGAGVNLNTDWLKRSEKRERLFQMEMGFNTLSPRVPESNFLQPDGLASLVQLNLYYHQLWKIERFSDSKNNLKVGGAIRSSQHIRSNPFLQNNALGLENLSNLMATVQFTRDISRKEEKQLNLLIFKPILKPVKRDLIFLFNAGVLNFNYRPGYAYTYDAAINGTETDPLSWVFSDYKWSLSGWRFNTRLEYIKYLSNGNARSWSYVWEAAHAPGRYEAFQMASHQIQYTIYFHTKKQ